METEHGDSVDVLPGLGSVIVLRILDSEGRLAIARLTANEADAFFSLCVQVMTDQAGRHRGPPIIMEV